MTISVKSNSSLFLLNDVKAKQSRKEKNFMHSCKPLAWKDNPLKDNLGRGKPRITSATLLQRLSSVKLLDAKISN